MIEVTHCNECEGRLNEIGKICVRVPRSHRKMNYFISRLGYKPQFLYSFRFSGNFVYVTGAEYERVKPYVTRAMVDFNKLLKCWNG